MRTCWLIREALAEDPHPGIGQVLPGEDREWDRNGASAAWRMDCQDCEVRGSGVACWEQCSGCPCCCAPIHVTCDFCVLYIEHRREIAGLARPSIEGTGEEPGASLGHPKGGTAVTMERTQLQVPDMYADHHVLRVRTALTALPGVQEVIASAAFRTIAVIYDSGQVSAEAIQAALVSAGYPPATGSQPAIQVVPVVSRRGDPAWDRLGFRAARTDARDVKANR